MTTVTDQPWQSLQPQNEAGPVFREPWEAQVFALVLALHEQGVFSWQEWAAALGEEIVVAQAAGDPDLGDTYYQHWLRTLERLLLEKKHAEQHEVSARIEQWRSAYLATPHGEPVELQSVGNL